MRLAGKIEAGAGAGPRTGHPECFSPARMVFTSEMLSALVRLFGCVAATRRIAESGAVGPLAPLRAVSETVAAVLDGVVVGGAVAATRGEESLAAADGFADAAFSPPHATAASRLDDKRNGRREIGIVPGSNAMDAPARCFAG